MYLYDFGYVKERDSIIDDWVLVQHKQLEKKILALPF